MNSDVSYLEDCPVPCLPGRTHCLHQAAMGLPRTKAGLSHFADQHFDGPNKLHVCCNCWMTAGQDADGVFHFPVNPEIAALRKDAERYRWLRREAYLINTQHADGRCAYQVQVEPVAMWIKTSLKSDDASVDAAIDAALADKPLSGPAP